MSIYHLYKGKDENDGLDLEQQKQNISSFIKAQFSAENLVFLLVQVVLCQQSRLCHRL